MVVEGSTCFWEDFFDKDPALKNWSNPCSSYKNFSKIYLEKKLSTLAISSKC